MAMTYEFYCERADAAAALAALATLDNVRERELRSERTWRGLAEHARKIAEERAKAEALRSRTAPPSDADVPPPDFQNMPVAGGTAPPSDADVPPLT